MAAIVILTVLIFNWVGYQLYSTIAANDEDRTLITRLDKDQYRDSDLISIKIPAVHLSPYVNENDFERVNGQIEIQGRVFNYVKRRFFKDSLELLCIPNDQATLLRIAKYDFFKLVADLQAEQSKKTNSNNSTHKNLNGQYFREASSDLLTIFQCIHLPSTHIFVGSPTAVFTPFDGQPPRLSC